MKTAEQIRAEIALIESDERYHYRPAQLEVNGYLAIMQIEWKSRVSALQWVLEQ